MSGLNPAQRDAVETLSGPMLVLAGAGTGKTRVVTFRIARLIRAGVKPPRILAVTFTNKAAQEMQERIGERLRGGKKNKKANKPQVSTFHAHCLQILRRQITRLGYPARFSIYDRGDQEGVAREVLRELRVPGAMLRPGDLLSKISDWKCRAVLPADAAALAATDKEHLAAAGYRRYQNAIRTAGAVDFDDLLLCTEELFRSFPEVRREEAARFDHLLIDEYQDTNGTQYRIVRALAAGHRNLCVVGDDDQSIYGWRGAEVEHILSFTRDWPDAKIIRLEQNYRSTHAILEMANRLIAFNSKRHDKVLRAARPGGERPRVEQFPSEVEEARGVVADIRRRLQRPGAEPRDFAILFRTNEQPRAFETELRRVRLPYVVLGTSSFFDRKEVRDVLSYLKVCSDPRDEPPLLRIANTPRRGIGQAAVQKMMAAAVIDGVPVWEKFQHPPAGLSSANRRSVDAFVELVGRHAEAFRHVNGQGGLASRAQSLISEIDYQAEINRNYDDPQERQRRWFTVEEVVNALGSYEAENSAPSLDDFLDEVVLGQRDFDNDKEKQLRQNSIALLTLHSAKGLEFPQVYMVGLEEGILPHHRSVKMDGTAIDEERRLCYVGVTRAQERLTLSMALGRMKWGKLRETIPSRFLFELTGMAERV